MQKILITGGAGNVGGALARYLVNLHKYHIVVVDNLRTGSISKLPDLSSSNFNFIQCDVNNLKDISAVMLAYKFDYVFHYAALVGVKRTLDNPIDVLKDIEGIKNVLSLSKNTGVKRVFFSSSSEVYGEPVEFPQNEYTTPLNSRLPYAIVKNVGEAFFRSYFKEYGLEYTIFRFFNTYGPNQSSDFVVSKFIDSAIQNLPITIYGDGKQTRTFCYIDDNIEATTSIFEKSLYRNEIVNIGNDVETTILELAKTVIEVSNSSSEIKFMPALEEGDMTRRLPDINRMKKVLQADLVSIEDGIRKVIESKLLA
jgi:nucleoside-diphosphate-sugar epimerase